MQAIAHRHVDDPVLAPNGYRRLGSTQRQGKEPAPAAPTENDADDVMHACLVQVSPAAARRAAHAPAGLSAIRRREASGFGMRPSRRNGARSMPGVVKG